MPSLEFENLPLAEVVIRLTPTRPLPFNVAFAVNLSSALKDRLPEIDDLVEFEPPPGRTSIMEFATGRLFGARYKDPERGVHLGVQNSLVYVRWVRDSKKAYPRFSVLNDLLWFSIEKLRAIVSDIRFDVANMSYTNFVVTKASNVTDFLDRYFLKIARPEIIEQSERFHGLNISWQTDQKIDLRLAIERGGATLDNPINREEGYKITTVAGVRFAEDPAPKDAVKLLHDRLQILFHSILSDDAKKEWGHVQP
jgi:uncharacterized protein (TIGR04255 family)